MIFDRSRVLSWFIHRTSCPETLGGFMFQSPCTPRPWKVMVLAVVDKMLIHLSCQKEMDLYRIFFYFTLNVRMSNGKYWHSLLGFWHVIYFIEEIEVTLIYVLCAKQRRLLLSHFRRQRSKIPKFPLAKDYTTCTKQESHCFCHSSIKT